MRANSTRGGTNVHIIGVVTNEANTNINTGLYNNFLYTFTYTGKDDKKNKILIVCVFDIEGLEHIFHF